MREGGDGELVRVVTSILGLRVGLDDEVLDLVVDVDRSHGSCDCCEGGSGMSSVVFLGNGNSTRPMRKARSCVCGK